MIRLCEQCGRQFTPNRPHHVYDTQECRNQAHIERGIQEAGQRVSDRAGSRGGTVRSVEEARELQEASAEKAEWSLKVSRQIALSLLTTGRYHPDDLDCLGIPPACANVIGAQTNSFSQRHFMFEVGRRKISHKAANGRKAAIWQRNDSHIDELRKLAGHRVEGRDQAGSPTSQPVNATPSPVSGEPSSEVLTGASEGPPALFEVPPERPRSAFTEPEAA